MTLRNKYLGNSNYDIDVEEEIDLTKQAERGEIKLKK